MLRHNAAVRWLITGASGFLGANAARVLAPRHDVVGLVRSDKGVPGGGELVVADLLSVSDTRRVVEETAPDVVLHCAALADHRQCEINEDAAMLINATASGQLAEVAQDVGARFVYISTDAVFSGERGWYSEDEATSPNSAYGRSKAAGEEAVVAADPSAVIARTNFFGWSPNGQRSILEFFVRELSAGNRAPGFTNYAVTSLFIENVIESIEDIVDSGETGVFHVVSRDGLAKVDFGRLVAAEFGFDGSLIDPTPAPGPDRNLSLRTDRLTTLRGADMPSQAEGVARAHVSPRF